MQNFSCNCLNVIIRAAPSTSMNPDEVSSTLLAIEQDSSTELAGFARNSRLVKIGHEPIKIRHGFLCAHRPVGSAWSLCVCSSCDLITHAVRVGYDGAGVGGSAAACKDNNVIGSAASSVSMADSDRTGSIDGLVLVNSSMLSDDQSIDSLRNSPNFSPVFDIVVPPVQMAHDHHQQGYGSDWMSPPSLTNPELEHQIIDNVRGFLKNEQEAKDMRIRAFVLDQERAFDMLCQSVQISRLNFVHLVESVRKRHQSASNDKENVELHHHNHHHQRQSHNGAGHIQSHHGIHNPKTIDDQEHSQNFEIFASDLNVEFEHTVPGNGVGGKVVSSVRHNQHQQQSVTGVKEHHNNHNQQQQQQHENYYSIIKLSSQPANTAQQQSSAAALQQPKRFARSVEYDDGLFQMDDIETAVEHELDVPELEDGLPDVEGADVHFASFKSSETIEMKKSVGGAHASVMAADRVRKVSNIQNVPFSYRDNRVGGKSVTGMQIPPNSLPIPIPHLQSHVADLDDDISADEDIADRILKMTQSVRNNENYILEDRPRRRLNTCDLIKSNRQRFFRD